VWTFPSILAAAFLVAWGAEATQFLTSQGLALAILAWLQTLPEFAVEAVIAWDAGRDPTRAQLAVANLTGAIRLLLGLGWPMIYFVHAAARRAAGASRSPIRLEREHSVELMGLLPPLLYFGVILVKGSFTWADALVLVALYLAYLWLLLRQPPRAVDDLAAAAPVSRWAYGRTGWRRPAAVGALFAAGGILLVVTVHPFLESMLALAGLLGASQFVVVQWVAPLLSEFPEKVSAFYWARRVTQAPLALMNLVSSSLNQWTVLAAMIPLVYGYSSLHHHGAWQAFHFDAAQRFEIGLALLQTGLGVMLLATMEFGGRAASVLFLLWLAQFVRPGLREAVAVAYGGWMALLILQVVLGWRVLRAPQAFWEMIRKRDRPAPLYRGPADRHNRNGEDY
jgi:cation:H+ antiporter